jgi:hypothetical protein
VAGLYTHPDCAAAHLVPGGLALDLTTPVQEGGVTLFRYTLYVRVPLDERCQRVVAAPASKLQALFEPATVEVTRENSAWVRKWQETGVQAVRVQLAHPAPIAKVHSDIYDKVALHRVDGDAVATEPTVEASTGQPLGQSFVASAFQAAFEGSKPAAIAKLVSDMVHQSQKQAFQSLSAKVAQEQSIIITGDRTFDEAKLHAILKSALDRIDLSGRPTTPRLKLLSADRSESLWQWVEQGEHAGTVAYAAQGADLVEQLQPALDRAFALREGAAAALVLPLSIESDAPCRVTLQQAHLEFELQADLLSEPAQVTFVGGSERTQLISLQAPAAQSVRLQFQASVAQRDPQTAGEPGATLDHRTGVQLDSGMQAAALWEADRAYWLIGMAIAWYDLSEHASLHVSLVPEAGGPGAATGALAEGTLALAASAVGPAWLRFRWPQAALQQGRYWLRVQVESGSGVWLGEATEGSHPLWQQPPGAGTMLNVPLKLLHFALEPAGPEQAQSFPVRLQLNGIELAAVTPRANALAAEADSPAALAAASPWSLAASSASDLSLTVQSALLTYRVT